MDVPYDNYQQNYGYDARHYDAEMAGNGSYGNNGEPHAPGTGMEYGRDRRDVDYNQRPGGGRGNDYGYDSRGMGDRGGGNPSYQREGSREYDRFSDGYDDSASNSSRDRDRERDRDRSRRDRDRRDRHRPRDRDHERSRERRERRDRDRSPSGRYDDYGGDGTEDSQSYRDRDRDGREAREDRGGEKWMTDTPTNTILLRGLPSQVDEKDIRAELMMFGAPVKDVRLMRRSTGASRGFAFVEFQNVTDAQRWMDQKQGLLNMLNQYSVTMHYSTPRVGPEKFVQHKTDWTCSKCGVHNFKRRDYCFKCNISREESDKTKDGDGFDQVGTNPCNTLIFRGLDALTTEESLDAALRLQTNLQSKNVRIIRDPVTNTSRGYGFCEMNSIQESTQVLDYLSLNNVPLEVDGKQVLVAYAKNTFSTVMATLNSTSQQGWDYATQQAAVQQGSDFYSQQQYYLASGTPSAASVVGEYDPATGQYYNQATGQYYDAQNYDYSQYYAQQGAGLQTDTTNAAAAVAQAAIAQANAAKNYNRQNSGPKKAEAPSEQATTTTVDGRDYPVYPPPDVSTYQFDKSSGYYYDASTGLYYDANSQFDCPVKDCDVSVVWHKLREHWLNVHEATITCYTCPLPSCQFRRDKKSTGKYKSRVNFLYHLNKCHEKIGSQCDMIVNMAKMEINENPNFIDPGQLLCPQPKQVAEPTKQIEKVAKSTASKQKGKSIASLSTINLSIHQKKKLRKAEQSSLVVIKTSSNKTEEPKREQSWIFGTSKKKKKQKKNTETLEPKKKLQQLPQEKIMSQFSQEKMILQSSQEKMKLQQKKKLAAKLRAELIAQESAVPVPELYDPTPTKAKKELTRPLLKLKLKVSATTIKEKEIPKINCPVPNCSDAFEAKYSEKLKHYYKIHVQNHFQCPECKSNFGYPDFNVHMKTKHDYADEKLGSLENVAVTNENFIDPGSHVSYFFEPEAAEEETETPTGDGESIKEGKGDDKMPNSNDSGTEELRSISDNQDVVEKTDTSQISTSSIAEPSADEKGDQCGDVALSSADYAGRRSTAGRERIIRSREGVASKDDGGSSVGRERIIRSREWVASKDDGGSSVGKVIIRSREQVTVKDGEINSAGKDRIMSSTSISTDSAKAEGKPSSLTKGKSVKTEALDERYRYYPFKCPVPQCHIILNSGADRIDHFEKFHNKYYYRCSFCGLFFQKNLFRPHLKKDHMVNFHIVNVQLQGYKTPNPFYIDPGCFLDFFVSGVIGGVRPKQILANSEGTTTKGEFIKSSIASTSSVKAKSDSEKTEKKDIDSTKCYDTQTEDNPSSGVDNSKHIAIGDSTTSHCKRVASVSESSLPSTQTIESSDLSRVNEDASQIETTKYSNERDSVYPMKCPVPQCSVILGSRMQRVDHYEISHYKFLFQCHLCHKTFQRRLFRPHLKHDHFLNVSKEAARVVSISNPHYVDPGCFEDFLEKGILKEVDKQKYLASFGSADSKNTASTSSVQGKSDPEKTDSVAEKDNDSTTGSDTLTEKKSLSGDESSSKVSYIEVDKTNCGEESASVSLPSLLSPQTSVSSDLSGVNENSSQNEPREQPVDHNGEDALSSADYAGGGSSEVKEKIIGSSEGVAVMKDGGSSVGKEMIMSSQESAKTKTKLASLTKGKSVKTEALDERYRYYPFKCPVPQCHIILNSGADRIDHFEKFHNKYYYRCSFCGLFFQKNLFRPHLKKDHMVNFHIVNVQLQECKTPNPFYIDPGCFLDFFVRGVIGGVRPKQILANSEGTTTGRDVFKKSSIASTSSVKAKSDSEKTEKKDIDSTKCYDTQTEDNPSSGVDNSKHIAIEDGTTSYCKRVASVNEPSVPSTQTSESYDRSGVNDISSQNVTRKLPFDQIGDIYPLKCPVPRCLVNLHSDKQRVDHYEISHFEYLFQCHVCHKSFQRRLLRPHLNKEHRLNFSGEALEEVKIPNPHYVDPGLFEDFLEKRILKGVDKQKYLASCGSAESEKNASTSSVQGKSDPEKTDAVEKKDNDSTTGSESSIKENIIEVCEPDFDEEALSVDQRSSIYPIKCPVPRCLINLRSDKQRIDHFEISHYKFLSQCHLCHKHFQRKLFRPHLKNDHNLDPTQEVVRENQIPNPHYVDPGLFQDFLEKNILKDIDKQKYLASCWSSYSNRSKIYPMKCPVPRCLINLRSDKQRVDHFEISHFSYLFRCHFCHKNFQRKLFRPHLKNDHNLDPNSVSENEVRIPNPHYVDPGLFEKFLEKKILKDIDKQMYLASCTSAELETSTSTSRVQNKLDKTHSSKKKDTDSTTGSDAQTEEKTLPGVERSMKDTTMEGSTPSFGENDVSVNKSTIYPIKCPVPQCFINLWSDKQRVNHYEISHFKYLFLCHLCHKSFQRRLIRPHLENDHNLDTKSMSENEVKIPNPHYVDPGLFEDFLEKGILKYVDKQMYLASCGSTESNTSTSTSSVHDKSDDENTDSFEKKEVTTCSDTQAEEKTIPEEESFFEKSTTRDALLFEENAKSSTVADEDKPVEENPTGPKNHNTKPNGMEESSSVQNVTENLEGSPYEKTAIEEVENVKKRTTREFVSVCTQNKAERETLSGEDNSAAEMLDSVGKAITKSMAEKDNSNKSESKTRTEIEISTEDTSSEALVPLSDEVKRIAVSEQDTSTGLTSKVESTVTTIQTAADAPPRLQSLMSTAEKKNTGGPHLAASKTVVINKSATISRPDTRSLTSEGPIATICKGTSHAQVESKKDAITSGTEGGKNKNPKPSIDCLKSIATVHSVRPNLLTIKTVDDYTPAAKMSFSSPTIMAGKAAKRIASVGIESTNNVPTSAPQENAEQTLDRNSEKCFTKETISDVATPSSVVKNEKSVSGEGELPTKNTDTESAGQTVVGKKTLSGVTSKGEKNSEKNDKDSVTSIEKEEHSTTDVKIMKKVLEKDSPKSITTAHSVRPNLLAIKTVEDFGIAATSSVPSGTTTTKRKEESKASIPKHPSLTESVKGLYTNEKIQPRVDDKKQLSNENMIYPLKCPVPECQFEIKSCTERVDHFEKIHYKYYFGCKICGGIFQKKLFRPHQKKDHFLNKTGTLDEAKIPNPYYINPGTFLLFFTMGILKDVNYKSNQHNPPVIESMLKEEAKSCSQKTVSGHGRKQKAKPLTKDELKTSTEETKCIKAESRGSKPESKRRKPDSTGKQSDTTGSKSELKQSKSESLETQHKSTRSKHETTRKKPESRGSKPNSTETKRETTRKKPESRGSKPQSTETKHESSRRKPESNESNMETTESKPDSTGRKSESTETKPKSTGTKLKSSKPESTGTKPESTGTKPKSSKSESTGTKPKSSKPESTGTKPKSSKPESTGTKPESTGTKPKSSKPESTGTKPESTGTKPKSSKPESTGTKPKSTGTKPKSSKIESTGTKPESTGTKPKSSKSESTGTKPESTGTKLKSRKPESTGSKFESTGTKTESTGGKPESKKNTTDSKDSSPEEGASKLETNRSTDITKGSKSGSKGNTRDSRESKHDSKTNADNSKKRTVHYTNQSKSDLMHRDKPVSNERKRKVEKEPIDKSKRSKRNDSRERGDYKRERKGTKHSTESRTASRRRRNEQSKSHNNKPATWDYRKRKTDKSNENAKRLKRDRSREERKGSQHNLKPKTDSIKNRRDDKASKTETKGRELIQVKTDGERRSSKDEKSKEKSNPKSTIEESKKLPWIDPKVIYASEPCGELPTVGNTEVELMWFLNWTDEYIVKLEEAQRDAERQLKDINP